MSYTGKYSAPYDKDHEGSLSNHANKRHLEYFHQPPEGQPSVPQQARTYDCLLWLSAQQAIYAFTSPISQRSKTKHIHDQLSRVSEALTLCDRDLGATFEPSSEVYYYASRVLLSFLAPVAPAFAEECWVVLHYGPDWANIEPSSKTDTDSVQDVVEKAEQSLGHKNLPRVGRPDTLQSIFEQLFPTLRPSDAHPATDLPQHLGNLRQERRRKIDASAGRSPNKELSDSNP